MDNNNEPRPGQPDDQLPDAAQGSEANASNANPSGTNASSTNASGTGEAPLSSDVGWRSALSNLGVDVESDTGWRAGSPGGSASGWPESRISKADGKADGGDKGGEEPRAKSSRREHGGSRDHGGSEEMEGRPHWVSEDDVSIERLYELFDAAYMECELDDDGDLRVVTDSGPRIFLSLHEPNKLLRYMAFYKFREEAGEYDKLLFVNALNDDIVFIRFSLNGTDTLIADYYLPYARGASPFHIVNAAKLMGRVITSGIRQHDTNNLLE